MTETTQATALTLADVVWTRLQDAVGVAVFDGGIFDDHGNPTSPPADEDGRAAAHAVFYPTPGYARAMLADGTPDTLGWGFQITCVGGDRTRTLWCLGQVRGLFQGWRTPGGVVVEEAGDPGPLRRDDDPSPPRFYLPLLFTTTT